MLDAAERQRLLYTMAAMAAADGNVDDRERRMLKLCAERWGVPYENVEMALNADPALFERLVPPRRAPVERPSFARWCRWRWWTGRWTARSGGCSRRPRLAWV